MRIFSGKLLRKELPVLPLREMVFFPGLVLPVVVHRKQGKDALHRAMESDRRIIAVTQTDAGEEAESGSLHEIGTISHVIQLMKMPDGSLRIMLEGQERVRISDVQKDAEGLRALPREITPDRSDPRGELPQLARLIQDTFKEYALLSGVITTDTQRKIAGAESADRLADLIGGHVPFELENRLKLLGEPGTANRLAMLAEMLNGEVELLKLKRSVKDRVRKRLEKNQRDYFLQEQIRELNRELGNESGEDEAVAEIRRRMEETALPEPVVQRITKELDRLQKLPPVSPESGIIRTYLDWLLELPWMKAAGRETDLAEAAAILDADHYDMRRPKDRLLEYMAVHTLNREMKSPILCFVGPPGTGKTSLGRSVARALGREFVRLSLGGVRDEAEIRGHRRTYVGALPGRIIQSIKRAGTHDPVILLDEIDKIGNDFRGDPSSALLEVLDPEQNGTFSDHYIELPFDLSQVTFLTTANSVHTVPAALRDRLEIIEIPGYTELEKLHIARDFLIPEQLRENGLPQARITFRTDGVNTLIREYTAESGVRGLKREIASVARKLAREMLETGADPSEYTRTVGAGTVRRLLGPPRYRYDQDLQEHAPPGLARGLAWTENGGVALTVETALFEGSDTLILTGSLGDVMKESARTALSLVLSERDGLGLELDRTSRTIHIHVPQGAIPKDGPSAGITIYAALISLLADSAVPGDVAMTGELTLTGRILPVGGIREKLLAAQRKSLGRVVLPEGNRMDVEDLPREGKKGLDIYYVEQVREILPLLFPGLTPGSPVQIEEATS